MEEEVKPQLPVEPPEPELPAPSFWERAKINKSKIFVSVLGIFVFAGAVFGAYKLGQRQVQPPQPTPTPEVATPTPDPTADWKTYTNTEYGYSIKYPKDWNTSEPEGGPERGRRINFHPWRERSFEEIDYQISIIVHEVSRRDTLNSWLDEKIGSYPKEIQALITREDVILDNFEGERVLEEPSQAGVYNIYTQKGQFIYNFMLAPYSPKDLPQLLPESLDYFSLMLSTFRFLEEATPTPLAKTINYRAIQGWTRCDNISGGYSIQYNPAEYKVVDEDTSSPIHSIVDELIIPCTATNCQTGIWIRIYSNYDGGSLLKWLEDVRNISRTERYLENVVVENKKSLIAMDDRITEIAIPLEDRAISVEMKGPFYNTTQKSPVNIEFVYQFLSTFRFR
jgi:hypothetical protein